MRRWFGFVGSLNLKKIGGDVEMFRKALYNALRFVGVVVPVFVLALLMSVPSYALPIFDVAASQATITQIQADIVAWATAFISVVLVDRLDVVVYVRDL